MKWLILFILLLPGLGAGARELRVLFVGNSLTGYNNMPGLFGELAKRTGHSPHVAVSLKFGQTLATQFADPRLREALRTGHWDFIVLQEYSDLPLRDPRAFLDDVSRFERWLGPAATRLLLFENWPYRGAAPGTMTTLRQNYARVAAKVHAQVVPVGEAMDVVTAQNLVDVYVPTDNKHPSVIGTYVGALSFLSFFYGVDPRSAPHVGANKNTPDDDSGPALMPSLVNLDAIFSPYLVNSVQAAVALTVHHGVPR